MSAKVYILPNVSNRNSTQVLTTLKEQRRITENLDWAMSWKNPVFYR
jgi:hypothetical protein